MVRLRASSALYALLFSTPNALLSTVGSEMRHRGHSLRASCPRAPAREHRSSSRAGPDASPVSAHPFHPTARHHQNHNLPRPKPQPSPHSTLCTAGPSTLVLAFAVVTRSAGSEGTPVPTLSSNRMVPSSVCSSYATQRQSCVGRLLSPCGFNDTVLVMANTSSVLSGRRTQSSPAGLAPQSPKSSCRGRLTLRTHPDPHAGRLSAAVPPFWPERKKSDVHISVGLEAEYVHNVG